MRLVIVTGMSGAGKSTALKILEDAGYLCVDNLPIPLIPGFVEMLSAPDADVGKAAVGIDVRNGQSLDDLARNAGRPLDGLARDAARTWPDAGKMTCEVLFLDASDDVLVKRYKETRRQHPLGKEGHVGEGIAREREKIAFLKRQATYILDTSKMLTRELKAELDKIFVEGKDFKNLYVTIMSFGFKYGLPQDADLVFDVRFLPNPYYVEGLKEKTGNDVEVQDYVLNGERAAEFLEKFKDMVGFLLPNYILEGKNQLVIAVGCTGGKHRSVTMANALYAFVKENEDYGVRVEHRDIGKR